LFCFNREGQNLQNPWPMGWLEIFNCTK